MIKMLWRLTGALLTLNLLAAGVASADTPQLPTKCIAVRDSGLFESRPTDKKDAPLRTGESNSDPACANLGSDARPLVGTGDLIIAVDKTAFTALKTSQGALSGAFVLYLNGIPLPGDAMLIASETVDQYVQLRFRIRQGPETQRLWSMLYADGALFEPTALYPALGWSSNDATQTLIPLRGQATSVSITTGARLVLALLLVVLAIAAIVYVGRATDTLRDEPDSAIPPWWKTARKLRARMAQLSDDTARNQDLKEKYPDFDGTDVSRYDDLASKALAGEPVEAADVNATCFGLALRKPDWKPVRVRAKSRVLV